MLYSTVSQLLWKQSYIKKAVKMLSDDNICTMNSMKTRVTIELQLVSINMNFVVYETCGV